MAQKTTGERLETFIFSDNSVEHLHRYSLANNYVKNKIVLDIASGEGYGSNIISENAAFVYGVDIDKETIKKSKLKYKKKNLTFLVGSADAIPIDDHSIDVIISFETIEHHDKHEEMLSEIKRVLKSDGILIISTPDKLYYSDKRNYNNRFHVKELYKHEFYDLISNNFSSIQLLEQRCSNGNSIIQDEQSQRKISFLSGDYSAIENKTIDPLYLIAIASNFQFEKQDLTIFDGNKIFKTYVQDIIDEIYKSRTYRVGNFFLKPFKFLKNKIKNKNKNK